MATLRELLTATDADLVRLFYRLNTSTDTDFIKRINQAAVELRLNHSQLVCALGFNTAIGELTDILTLIGFASYKMLIYRRNELFVNDPYAQLALADIETIYTAPLLDAELVQARHELVLARLRRLEQQLDRDDNAKLTEQYQREVQAIYAGNLGTLEFMMQRVTTAIGDKRILIDEIQMIVDRALIPVPNLFFSDFLLPIEKRYLIDCGHIEPALIANRLQNTAISEDERQMLEDYLK